MRLAVWKKESLDIQNLMKADGWSEIPEQSELMQSAMNKVFRYIVQLRKERDDALKQDNATFGGPGNLVLTRGIQTSRERFEEFIANTERAGKSAGDGGYDWNLRVNQGESLG